MSLTTSYKSNGVKESSILEGMTPDEWITHAQQKAQFRFMFSSREIIYPEINIVLGMSRSNYTVLYVFKSRDDCLLFLTFVKNF